MTFLFLLNGAVAGSLPSHSQLGGHILCATRRAHQSVPVPTCWAWKHLLPVGHSAAVRQPLSTGRLVSKWFLTPDQGLSTGTNWSLLGNGLICVCRWFLTKYPDDVPLPVWPWVHRGVNASLGWAGVGLCLSRVGFCHYWSGQESFRQEYPSIGLPIFLLERKQRLLPHPACPDDGRRKISPKRKDQSGDVGSRCPSPGSAMN